MPTDRTTNPTVIEYAVQYLFKGKSPSAAAKATARKLDGTENMFLGPGVSSIDELRLEDALWQRLVEFTISGVRRVRPGYEHYALDGTVQHFRQGPGVRKTLKRLVEAELGKNIFENDDR